MRTVQFIVPSDGEYTLVRQYLEMIKPIHKMTKAEMDVIALIVQKSRERNGELSRVLSLEGRLELRDELDISENALNVLLSRLRRKKVLTANELGSFLKALEYDEEGLSVNFVLKLNAQKD